MVEKGISLGKSSETNINSIRALATQFWVEHKAAIIKTAVFASTIPLALMAAQDVLAQANDLCYNLACEIGHGTWEQWMSVYKMDGWIVDSSGVLQAIGASQASCDPGDANFQMLEALGDSAESEQFFNINLAADPDVIDVCGVSPQPAELARVLEVNAGLAGQLPDPGIIPAVPTEAVLPEIPPGIASPDGVIPGVEPGAPIDYDGYVLPALGVVCGIPLAIWGVGAGIGLLRSHVSDRNLKVPLASDGNNDVKQKGIVESLPEKPVEKKVEATADKPKSDKTAVSHVRYRVGYEEKPKAVTSQPSTGTHAGEWAKVYEVYKKADAWDNYTFMNTGEGQLKKNGCDFATPSTAKVFLQARYRAGLEIAGCNGNEGKMAISDMVKGSMERMGDNFSIELRNRIVEKLKDQAP